MRLYLAFWASCLSSCFVLNQFLAFFYFLSVNVRLTYVSNINSSTCLLILVLPAASFAALPTNSLALTPTCPRTQWIPISTSLPAGFCTVEMKHLASHYPGPGAVCCSHTIAACKSVKICTFVHQVAAPWEGLTLPFCPSPRVIFSASTIAYSSASNTSLLVPR